ncbi:MAG: nucleoside triphosphate pyrophosphatase [Pseudotabrizicola sp.]|uniref:Maf family protein n=1 Tax=Pseudotabrizicola sp. TaxID=2939647 RepID=UPI002728A8DA|nr:nucleoside triphosphate pyrophosphatase [Pseudotabrizicola sp.]MDO8883447.1 nucleoside triphosphate pyrophosphatase [Pseudotabrizicola sp.]MDP2083407.1 nucleoside triphosphate pyrophosphatase [Pseudotabrizicola sp.]MDZ7574945.1 nucleoside triphosphate pyrophosphatase [Pseudotabrizicola sp.]
MKLILASTSQIRQQMLTAAGVPFTAHAARVDEDTIRRALQAEHARPRDIADTLAEMKARKIAERSPEAMVLGCDQVLDIQGDVLAKPETPDEARAQLRRLRGQTHKLWSAAVIYHDAKPVWRFMGEARLTMRPLSDAYLDDYVTRNWDSIRHSVGAYKLEEQGSRLFSAVDGDYFTVLGLPLLPVLGYLGDRGIIPT